MSYILLLVFSSVGLLPKSFSVSEFQSKEACSVALKAAQEFYKTVEAESRCISVEQEMKKEKIRQDIKKLKDEIK